MTKRSFNKRGEILSIFEFEDYKLFVNKRIARRGEFQRIARALHIHPTLVSHVLRGTQKEFSLEQATQLCKYLQLSTLETDYFLLLVQRAKSGSIALTQVLDRQLQELRKKARNLVHRVSREVELSEQDKAIFYSNWYYSAVRLVSSIEGVKTRDEIAMALDLPITLVQEVLQFLVAHGLCRLEGNKFSLGPALTHLEASSPLVSRHHTQWRLKVIEKHPVLTDDDLVFTGPLTISKKEAVRFREKLTQLIQELGKTVKESDPEELRCFNIDWVKI